MKKIPIKGAIVSNNQRWVYEWLDMDATSPRDVSQALDNANGEDIELEINSGGGSVVAGSEIWTALKEYKGKVTSKIVGIAGSAASFIAIAADNVMISPTALIMIHNASNIVAGDKRDMQHMANTLASVDEAISNAYRMKTGKDKDELLALMADETYMNAQLAKELGFADEIMFEEGDQLVASFNQSSILPDKVINKIRNHVKNPSEINKETIEEPKADTDEIKSDVDVKEIETEIKANEKIYHARLNLLKLKGAHQ